MNTKNGIGHEWIFLPLLAQAQKVVLKNLFFPQKQICLGKWGVRILPSTCELFMLIGSGLMPAECGLHSNPLSHMPHWGVGVINWLELFHCIFEFFSSSHLSSSHFLDSSHPHGLLYIEALNPNIWPGRWRPRYQHHKHQACSWLCRELSLSLRALQK